jgi:hypothetical protein
VFAVATRAKSVLFGQEVPVVAYVVRVQANANSSSDEDHADAQRAERLELAILQTLIPFLETYPHDSILATVGRNLPSGIPSPLLEIQPFFDANTGERKPRRMGVEYSPVGVSHLARLVHMLQRRMLCSESIAHAI